MMNVWPCCLSVPLAVQYQCEVSRGLVMVNFASKQYAHQHITYLDDRARHQ